MTSVEVTCPVFPSEDPDKVRVAMERIFPDIEIEETEDGLSGRTDNLVRFSKQIRKQRILDTTRSVLIRGRRGNVTRFFLNKQVAFVGKVSFCEERTILGTMRVVVQDDEMDALIEDVAPETVDGEEVLI
ncbi:MAG: hypothetical protein IJT54_05340 [Candidatus Methanomethylophilaceae archaeon]|nr:hypothetical protein [Candidatus Methanomethylophilaceae archaeon]